MTDVNANVLQKLKKVMDLVPVEPLVEEKSVIKGFYQNKLKALYKKLKS